MDIGTQILVTNALQHLQEKDLEKASELLIRAQKASPNNPDVLRFLSVVAAMQFNYGVALELIDQVISLMPDSGVAHSNRGNILKELHRYEEALASLDKAIALEPTYAEAYNNKGNVLQELHRYEEALGWYDKAIALQPNYAAAYSNKGNALEWLHHHSEAMENYDKAIATDSNYVDACWHKAMSQLRSGDFANGWRNYEARWKKTNPVNFQYKNIPRLITLHDVAGKKILIWAEQGLGDTIQFCRYIKVLFDLGAHITFQIQKPLMGVLKSLKKFCMLTDDIKNISMQFDLQSPLLSLPLLCSTSVTSIPLSISYLEPDEDKIKFFEHRYPKNDKLKVGLVWSGGFHANHPEVWGENKRRNIDLTQISKISDVLGVEFYSLQKGDPAESELLEKQDVLWPKLINCANLLKDFTDTAALIATLDLVISVDTSTAHLAGALGKPVWILNRHDSCWRWLNGRLDTPWYSSAKIYQQNMPGEWEGVINRLRFDLQNLVLINRMGG